MRKSALLLLVALLSLSFVPAYSAAVPIEPFTSTRDTEAAARAKTLVDRLEEIKAMDKSNMSRVEKKNLRREVRAIKAELRSTNNGIYLSVGAVIIIILLLILLL